MSEKEGLIGLKDSFNFQCHPGLKCFTTCCADVTIFLTPFDALRLSEHLQTDSTIFLNNYTMALKANPPVLPLVVLKMDASRENRCPFVGPEGCSVYESRPWACRLFPLDLVGQQDFRIMVEPEFCQGLKADKPQVVLEYLSDQGVVLSSEMDALYNEITAHPGMAELDVDNPRISRMIYMACYDLDRFEEFVFESTFLERFDVPEERLNKMKSDKLELLKFGFDWIKFGLFAEKTLSLKPGQEGKDEQQPD